MHNIYKTLKQVLCEQFTVSGHSGEHMILARNSGSSGRQHTAQDSVIIMLLLQQRSC